LGNKKNTRLIKGGQLHNLRLYLWFSSDGIVRRKQEAQQQKVVRSLNLITHIVLVWNTVYQQEIIKQLHQEGYVMDENDLSLSLRHLLSISNGSGNILLPQFLFWEKMVVDP
jgi:hypothetical protein